MRGGVTTGHHTFDDQLRFFTVFETVGMLG